MKNNNRIFLMFYSHFSLRLFFYILMLTITNFTFALSTDESKPVRITAGSGEANEKQQITTLNGGVVITRGSITVTANRGTVSQDANKDKIINLYGSPITFSQKQDDGEMVTGQCNQFSYDTKTNLAILTGRAVIDKGKDRILGETLTYNTKTQVYSANGLPANGINKNKKSGKITIILDNIEKQNATK